jgi:hypothetical protein
MKSCIIVNFWTDTEFRKNLLLDCLEQLNKTGIDIIYTSRYPVPSEVNDLVKYSIYSSNNDLITLKDLLSNNQVEIVNTMSHNLGNVHFYTCPLNYYNVSYSVQTQLHENLKYLKSLGYTHYHLLVGDCLISDEDLNNFKLVQDFVYTSNNKAYFEDLRDKFEGFSALYWFSEIDFFLEKTSNFTDKQSFINYYASPPNNNGSLVYEAILLNDFDNSNQVVYARNNNWGFGHLITFKQSKLDIITSYNSSDVFAIIPNQEHTYSTIVIVSRNGGEYILKINEIEFFYNLGVNSWQSYITHLKNFNLKIIHNNKTIVDLDIDEKILKKIWSYSFFT